MKKFVCMTALIFVSACGDDSNTNNIIPPLPDSGNNVNNTNNTNNVNNDVDMGTNNAVDPDEGCSNIITLDAIPSPETPLEREFREIAGYTDASCEGEEDFTGALLYRLEVGELTQLTVRADGIPRLDGEEIVVPPQPVVEIREAGCVNENSVVQTCSAGRETNAVLQPDTPYYLVVNGDLDSGGVRLQFETEGLVCEPGPVICTDGSFKECEGQVVNEFACVEECLDENTCRADTCESVVNLSFALGGDPVQLEGHRRAYSNSWDAADRPGCSLEDGVPAGGTPDSDFVVKLPNIRTGQTITVDAERSEADYVFYFLDACDAAGCLFAQAYDETSRNIATYTAESDGDVYLVVESGGPAERTFDIDVSVQ